VVVGVEEELAAELDDEGGRDEESKSWGRRERAGEDKAEFVDDNSDPLRFKLDDVGDGFGRPVMIFVAGRMSLLTRPFFASDIPRRCVAPTGISMYSRVAMNGRLERNSGPATENAVYTEVT
jgi:hypothetical protein